MELSGTGNTRCVKGRHRPPRAQGHRLFPGRRCQVLVERGREGTTGPVGQRIRFHYGPQHVRTRAPPGDLGKEEPPAREGAAPSTEARKQGPGTESSPETYSLCSLATLIRTRFPHEKLLLWRTLVRMRLAPACHKVQAPSVGIRFLALLGNKRGVAGHTERSHASS